MTTKCIAADEACNGILMVKLRLKIFFHSIYTLTYSGGKCGICGESYNGVKKFEKGGSMYTGIPVRTYTEGQEIDVQVKVKSLTKTLSVICSYNKLKVSANHKGWFEFRICNIDDMASDATQECLDKIMLPDLTGKTRINLEMGIFNFETKLKLPANLSCNQCVFQVMLIFIIIAKKIIFVILK